MPVYGGIFGCRLPSTWDERLYNINYKTVKIKIAYHDCHKLPKIWLDRTLQQIVGGKRTFLARTMLVVAYATGVPGNACWGDIPVPLRWCDCCWSCLVVIILLAEVGEGPNTSAYSAGAVMLRSFSVLGSAFVSNVLTVLPLVLQPPLSIHKPPPPPPPLAFAPLPEPFAPLVSSLYPR